MRNDMGPKTLLEKYLMRLASYAIDDSPVQLALNNLQESWISIDAVCLVCCRKRVYISYVHVEPY